MSLIPKPPRGSGSSSAQMSLFPEMSTSVTSETSLPETSTGTRSVTSSPASADGPMPCDWPDGRTTDLSGRDRVPANRSQRPESAPGSPTNGTSGLTSIGSSASAALQSSLESRLRVRLECSGSMLFSLIWKTRTTPSGRPICARRASALRTSAKDSSGWPSPVDNDAKGSDYTYNQGRHDSISLKLGGVAKLTSPWATPAARDYRSESATDDFNEKRWTHSRGKPLSAQVTLSAWVSPQAADANGSGLHQHTASLCKQVRTNWPSPKANNHTGAGTRGEGGENLQTTASLAMWPTPTASLADKAVRSLEGGIREAMRSRGPDLAAVSCLASWATPTAEEAGGTAERFLERKALLDGKCGVSLTSLNLQAQMTETSGPTVNGSPAETVKHGQLNAAFSRWLQGYPEIFDVCAIRANRSIPTTRRKRASCASGDTATASCRGSPSNSSAPIETLSETET